MTRWLERNGLKLTSLGERVVVAGAGGLVVVLCGLAFVIEGIINQNLGVI